MTQIFTKLDCAGRTVFYAAGDEADAVPMIEIRANVTEAGWDTIAFVESSWPEAEATARRIVHCLTTHADLLAALDYALMLIEEPAEGTNPTYHQVALRKAQAAIAKGRG